MKLPSRVSEKFEPPEPRRIRSFESEAGEINEERVPFRLRATLLVLVAMFTSLIVVALVLKIDRVIQSGFGQIVITEPTVVVQPLDMAIIKTIDVREGERVKAGQLLAELDSTFATADVTSLEQQLSSLEAQIARCEAELADKPYEYMPTSGAAGAELYASLQKTYFLERKAQYDSQLRAFDSQIAQANATIARLENDRQRYGDREKLIKELETMRAELVAKQLVSRVDLLTVTDQRTEMLRNLESVQNTIIETEHQIQSIVATRSAFTEQWRATASQELVQARNTRDGVESSLEKARKHQDVVRLTAPRDAIVLRMAAVSVGSILQPSQFLMELAPVNIPIEAEIYISPAYIGYVRAGDSVTIKLDSYDFVEHGLVLGKLRWISQGTFVVPSQSTAGTTTALGTSTEAANSAGGQGAGGPFYKARVSIDEVHLTNVPADFQLLPGMTLRADIHVGTRSLFWFLVRGLVRSYDESMREP
jgi:HlyD family secretion protein